MCHSLAIDCRRPIRSRFRSISNRSKDESAEFTAVLAAYVLINVHYGCCLLDTTMPTLKDILASVNPANEANWDETLNELAAKGIHDGTTRSGKLARQFVYISPRCVAPLHYTAFAQGLSSAGS